MKFYYLVVGLTLVLSLKWSTSQFNPEVPSSSKGKLPLLEEDNVCTTEQCQQTAERLNKYMDTTVNPCVDFYQFSCGNFGNHAVIKAGQNMVDATAIREDELNSKLLSYLNSDYLLRIQEFQRIQDLHQYYNDEDYQRSYIYLKYEVMEKIHRMFRLCMNEDVIEGFGDTVIQSELFKTGLPVKPPFHQLKNKVKNFDQILARMHRYVSVPFLFNFRIQPDEEYYKRNRFFITLTAFTVTYFKDESVYTDPNSSETPWRLHYKKAWSGTTVFKNHYKEYMIGVLEYLYQSIYKKTSKRMLKRFFDRVDKVIEFLTKVDQVKYDEICSVPNSEYITVQKLQETTDTILKNSDINFNWLSYLSTLYENINNVEELFLLGEPLIVNNMKYVKSIFEVISEIDEKVFEASLWWVTVNDSINIANKVLRTLKNNFVAKTKFQKILPDRENICLNYLKREFSQALTHLLLREINVKSEIDKVFEINKNVKNSFQEIIMNTVWLDKWTKQKALHKVRNIETFISHDSWIENYHNIEQLYANVEVKNSWYETITNIRVQNNEKKLKFLFVENESERKGFLVSPLETNTFYNLGRNNIEIPFGALGSPYINLGLHCMDYGAIGFYIAHEFTHSLDINGRRYDSFGKKRNWWNKVTLQNFNEHANCFVDFYSIYLEYDGTQVDGKKTLAENIADCEGLKLAFTAYDKHVAKNGPDKKLINFENYSSEQLLTLAMANSSCWIVTEEYHEQRNVNSRHAPNPVRVKGIFMNSERMSKIWGCRKNTPMNPSNKCYVWWKL